MHLFHKILLHSYPVLKILRRLALFLGQVDRNQLRVLIFHDIPESEEYVFRKQLEHLSKRWNIISPATFEAMMSGNQKVSGRNLLITFDDGLLSNRTISENVLQPLGINAIFFVIPDFVEIEEYDESKRFIANHLIPGTTPGDIPQGWRNMQWHDLVYLVEQGHTIGCHTRTHRRLSECNSDLELESELIDSANIIESRLSVLVKHFAFTFGDINSLSQQSLNIAVNRYHFIYSGIRGDNKNNVSPFEIRRDAAAYQLSDNEYRLFDNRVLDAFLDGFVDYRYAKPRRLLDSWLKQ